MFAGSYVRCGIRFTLFSVSGRSLLLFFRAWSGERACVPGLCRRATPDNFDNRETIQKVNWNSLLCVFKLSLVKLVKVAKNAKRTYDMLGDMRSNHGILNILK